MRLPASRPAAVRGPSLIGLINTPSLTRPNGELGIANREYVKNEDRSAVLDPEKLARVSETAERVAVAIQRRLYAAISE